MTSLQWVCFEGFRRCKSIFQSSYVCNHTIPGHADRLNIWQLPFSISEKIRMINFKRRHMAGPELNQRLLDSQSDSLSMLGTQLQGIHEPPHDKTNKMACAQRRHRSACASAQTDQSSLSAWRNIGSSYPLSALRRFWSDWADAQADLSLRWAQRPFCWFCHEVAHVYLAAEFQWILIFASGLRNKPHFWRPCSLALWL